MQHVVFAEKFMPFDSATTACPFVQKLIALVLDCSSRAGSAKKQALFSETLRLELDAERAGAPEASLRIIRTIREIAEGALSLPWPLQKRI